MVGEKEALVSYKVFKAIEPVVVLARSVGLCPIAYGEYGAGYSIKWSPKSGIYSYILAIVLAIATTAGIINDLRINVEYSFRMKNSTNKYITCCDISIIIFMVLLGVVLTPFKLKDLYRVLDRVYKIDQFIASNTTIRDRNYCILVISVILLLFSGLIIFDIVMWIRSSYESGDTVARFLRNYLSFYLMYCVVIIQEIYFFNLINLVKKRMQSMHNWLQSRRKTIEKGIIVRKLLVRVINPVNQKLKLSTAKLELDDTKNLTKIHELICEAIESIGDLCGCNILIIVLSCLLHLIITPYFLLLEIKNNGNFAFISLQLLWLITHTLRLVFIVEPCHSCSELNQKNLNLVFKLLSLGLEEDVKKQLVTLSQQMAYRTTDFSSCGLFKINRSLLTAVGGSVTTYLVILFQFEGR